STLGAWGGGAYRLAGVGEVGIGPARPPGRARPIPEKFRLIATALALTSPLVLIAIGVVLFEQAAPAVTRFGFAFLVKSSWNPVTFDFGALPFVYGTLATSAIALALALPVGIAVALVLA